LLWCHLLLPLRRHLCTHADIIGQPAALLSGMHGCSRITSGACTFPRNCCCAHVFLHRWCHKLPLLLHPSSLPSGGRAGLAGTSVGALHCGQLLLYLLQLCCRGPPLTAPEAGGAGVPASGFWQVHGQVAEYSAVMAGSL
jgi:hypothetical protein